MTPNFDDEEFNKLMRGMEGQIEQEQSSAVQVGNYFKNRTEVLGFEEIRNKVPLKQLDAYKAYLLSLTPADTLDRAIFVNYASTLKQFDPTEFASFWESENMAQKWPVGLCLPIDYRDPEYINWRAHMEKIADAKHLHDADSVNVSEDAWNGVEAQLNLLRVGSKWQHFIELYYICLKVDPLKTLQICPMTNDLLIELNKFYSGIHSRCVNGRGDSVLCAQLAQKLSPLTNGDNLVVNTNSGNI